MSPYDADGMYTQLKNVIETVKNPYLNQLLKSFFTDDREFIESFRKSSAAKTVHHGFVGGLIQHTLAVTRLCKYYTKAYTVLDHDLLISAALLHDIGKVRELTRFPENDYSDEGQLLGHIYMGQSASISFVIGNIENLNGAVRSLNIIPIAVGACVNRNICLNGLGLSLKCRIGKGCSIFGYTVLIKLGNGFLYYNPSRFHGFGFYMITVV